MDSTNFRIVECKIWDGALSEDQQALLARMEPFIEDMNREDEPIIYSWYEHTQWNWKRWEYASVLSHINPDECIGRRVLDAGCGYTPLIRYLASIGMEAYGFDWDADEQESILERSRTLLGGNLVKYHKQDMRVMQWPSNFFDYTVSVSVLEHLYEAEGSFQKAVDWLLPPPRKLFYTRTLRRALKELIRVTKPGGLIILTMDCGYGGGISVAVLEKLFGIRLAHFPDIQTIRSYWKQDDYYSRKNRIYPSTPREYTSFLTVLKKQDVQ